MGDDGTGVSGGSHFKTSAENLRNALRSYRLLPGAHRGSARTESAWDRGGTVGIASAEASSGRNRIGGWRVRHREVESAEIWFEIHCACRGTIGAVAIVLTVLASTSLAQVAVVKQNANLRPGPSSSQPSIRRLQPPEELRLLSLARSNGYYNVQTTANEVGWVWSAYVDVDDGHPGAIVERTTNLRPGPSASGAPIRLLTAAEELALVEPNPTNRYYHVRTTSNEEGWAYGPNLSIVSVAPAPASPAVQPPFPDAHDSPSPGWNGLVFKLSQDFPSNPPSPGAQPWKQFDFKTQADQYLRAVLSYAMDGNVAVEWQGDKNAVRKWYHAPWLHATQNGREFVRGLTRERASRPGELHPQQTATVANYAVGLYNDVAGYTIGRVWRDHENPDAGASRFAEGAVSIKLLFTMASTAQVPYLVNSLEWDGHVAAAGSTVRSIQKVRLLQVDVGIRDSRANAATGWVFGTFAYDGTAPGATIWERLRPVGLMWGNDPALTPLAAQGGGKPAESVILNPTIGGVGLRLGWLGRLNGPVDNPISACLSCHGTAQHLPAAMVPAASATDAQKMRWFRNVPAGQPFDSGQVSLDYSLQLAVGLRNFFDSRQAPDR